MSSNSKAAALLEHLETTLNDPQAIDELRSDALRFKLREISMKLSLSLEAVGDTVHRICNTVSCLETLRNSLRLSHLDIAVRVEIISTNWRISRCN